MIREEPPLRDEAVLVRTLSDVYRDGQIFHRGVLLADATVNFDAFGYYGLSLWAVSDAWPLERVLLEKALKARRVALFTVGDLRSQGLGLIPSGRAPHFDTTVGAVTGQVFGPMQVTAASAEELVDQFIAAAYTVVENHLFEQDPA
jgi:hypothetical protein